CDVTTTPWRYAADWFRKRRRPSSSCGATGCGACVRWCPTGSRPVRGGSNRVSPRCWAPSRRMPNRVQIWLLPPPSPPPPPKALPPVRPPLPALCCWPSARCGGWMRSAAGTESVPLPRPGCAARSTSPTTPTPGSGSSPGAWT
ncbi:MAG: hypothetical protein AVDCRST_MAG29-250, partial [uncultured Nocardioidaceae bacterium]